MSFAQVRIFPYLIGRESAFADNLKWMACANKGWKRFLWSTLQLGFTLELWGDVCGCLPPLCVICISVCMLAVAQTLSSKKQWSVTLGGVRGQSALIPLLVIAYLSAALCWWLLHVNSLDECPLTGKVTARKTDRRGVAEWQGPTPPPPPKSPTVKQSHTFSAKHNLALAGAGPKWFLQLQAPKPEINQVITKFVPLLREFMMREI